MGNVRDPAVAGFFYPADKETLASDVEGYLSAAPVPATLAPKALIAPHAGYVYSGQIAANAYAATAHASPCVLFTGGGPTADRFGACRPG